MKLSDYDACVDLILHHETAILHYLHCTNNQKRNIFRKMWVGVLDDLAMTNVQRPRFTS